MERKVFKKPISQTVRKSVTPRKRLSESEGDNTCVVCAHPMSIYAVGNCNHYICFKCSTKIRLLCEEELCPVCRKELDKVVFSRKKMAFSELESLNLIKDRDYDVGIYFADISIIKDYKRILEHRCPVCKDRPPDKTFEQTKVHLRKEHTLFYCEICLENNRTFTTECKVYSRKELATHKRVGDPNDTSHRGHPLCVYCDIRYLDDDKLFHHLRTTHFFCHLCDHGDTNEFYATYDDLREHFREKHFLCEEGECAKEEFTSVFGSEIDFKAHCATVHKVSRSKQQLKRDRQIDLEFQYSRRGPSTRGRGSNHSRSARHVPRHAETDYSNAFERAGDAGKQKLISRKDADSFKPGTNDEADAVKSESNQENDHTMFYQTDFPHLACVDSTAIEQSLSVENQDTSNETSTPLWSGNSRDALSNSEDFPSLPTRQPSAQLNANSTWNAKNITKPKKTNKSSIPQSSASSFANHPMRAQSASSFKKNLNDFPVLSSNSAAQSTAASATSSRMASQPKLSSKAPENKMQDTEDFPLSVSRNSLNQNNKTATVSFEHAPKQAKNPSTTFVNNLQDTDDFPILSAANGFIQNNSSSSFSTANSSKQAKSKPFKKNLQNDKDFPKLSASSSSTSSAKFPKKTSKSSSKKSSDFPKANAPGNSLTKHPNSYPPSNNTESRSNSKTKPTNISNNKILSSNDHKGKKSSKNLNNSSDGDEFPNLNPLNEVLVGRGSLKHVEGFESFADEVSSNVSVVPAKALDVVPEKPSVEYKHNQDDFPSLSFSKPSAPPGFANVVPTPFTRESFTVSIDKSSSSDGNSLFLANSSGIKPPPGFGSTMSSSKKPKSSSNKKQNNANSFLPGHNDFPSLSSVFPISDNPFAVKFPDEHTTATQEISVKGDVISKHKLKTNNATKSSSNFISQDSDADFPTLSSHTFTSPFSQALPEQTVQPIAKAPIAQKSSGTSLNLANVFDFPSL